MLVFLTLIIYALSKILVFIFKNKRKRIGITVKITVNRQKWEGIDISRSLSCFIDGIIILEIGIVAHGGRLSSITFHKKTFGKTFNTKRMMSFSQ